MNTELRQSCAGRAAIALLRMCLVAAIAAPLCAAEPSRNTGPWDVARILNSDTPAQTGETKGLVTEIQYRGEPYQGRETSVFAYYGRPTGQGPFPAMLLVHGGGGKAFSQWAQLWAQRGYVALAMDLAGNGPDGEPLPNGGPSQDDGTKFREFDADHVTDMWSYQAVAAVLRGHAYLASQTKEVDPERIGITGISWGGYLTSIVAGIDPRLKVAVPVYGCGFLADNSAWRDSGIFGRMQPATRELWIKNFDPQQYLPGVTCPILFVNGTNDFAYPLDSYQKSYRLVKNAPVTLRVTVNMPHGHEVGWAPQEIGAFVDSVLKHDEPLPRLSPLSAKDSNLASQFEAATPLSQAELHFTTDTGRWQQRKWSSIEAKIDDKTKTVNATLPTARPITAFLTVTDQRGRIVSTDHVTLE